MIRLNITAEGQCEMEFAKNALYNYFEPQGILIESRCVMTSRTKHKTYRGGLLDYQKAKKDIQNWIAEEKSGIPFFSTMFDLYALPDNFPKYTESLAIADIYQKVEFLEKALAEDINHPKFIPYLQLHEFEALLFAHLDILLIEYPDAEKAIKNLTQILQQHDNNPEKINTGKYTAPSKRIINEIPEYESNKVTAGAVLAGLDDLGRQKQYCKHFSDWLDKIANLAE